MTTGNPNGSSSPLPTLHSALTPPPGLYAAPPLPDEAMEAWEMDAGGPFHLRSLESVLKLPPTDVKGAAPRRITTRQVPSRVWDEVLNIALVARQSGEGPSHMKSITGTITWLGAAKLEASGDFAELLRVRGLILNSDRKIRRYLKSAPEFVWPLCFADYDRANVSVPPLAFDLLHEVGAWSGISDSLLASLALVAGLGAAEDEFPKDPALAADCKTAFANMVKVWNIYSHALMEAFESGELS